MVRILLVEDDALMVRMYLRLFRLSGYEVAWAGDGLEGLEKARQFRPGVILLDVMIPKLNGLQTLEKLKTDPETRELPVIILTNLVNKSDAEVALQRGAIHYLIKSEYDPQEIMEIIRRQLVAV